MLKKKCWKKYKTLAYILNGNTEGDKAKKLTCICPRGDSTIDYVILNEEAREEIIRKKVAGTIESDFMPLAISMESSSGRRKEET